MFEQEIEQRLPARAARRLAALRQALGDRAARATPCVVPVVRPGRAQRPTRRRLHAAVARLAAWSSACPTTCPIVGYGGQHREHAAALVGARRPTSSTSTIFNDGDYIRAVEEKMPVRDHLEGALPDRLESGRARAAPAPGVLLRRLRARTTSSAATATTTTASTHFADKVAIQLNDTHPALAVAELMRLLRRRERPGLGRAPGRSRTATFGYTNHTLLPEALESWPVALFERVLPRHLQIIYEINHRFLRRSWRRCPGDDERAAAHVDHRGGRPKQVRMAHLAIVGSHSVNGVAALHTELVKTQLLPRLPRALAGEVQQQDQRRHAAALAAARQPAARRR